MASDNWLENLAGLPIVMSDKQIGFINKKEVPLDREQTTTLVPRKISDSCAVSYIPESSTVFLFLKKGEKTIQVIRTDFMGTSYMAEAEIDGDLATVKLDSKYYLKSRFPPRSPGVNKDDINKKFLQVDLSKEIIAIHPNLNLIADAGCENVQLFIQSQTQKAREYVSISTRNTGQSFRVSLRKEASGALFYYKGEEDFFGVSAKEQVAQGAEWIHPQIASVLSDALKDQNNVDIKPESLVNHLPDSFLVTKDSFTIFTGFSDKQKKTSLSLSVRYSK
jgi:hypothetical protein